MTFNLWRFKFGVRWEDSHPNTRLWVGRSIRFFISYETDKLRQFRKRVKEAKNARESSKKGSMDKTTDDLHGVDDCGKHRV
jgi:hypothetical protein